MAPFMIIFSMSGLSFTISHFFHTFFLGAAMSWYSHKITRLYNNMRTVIVFHLKMDLFNRLTRVNLFTVAYLEIASKKRFGQNWRVFSGFITVINDNQHRGKIIYLFNNYKSCLSFVIIWECIFFLFFVKSRLFSIMLLYVAGENSTFILSLSFHISTRRRANAHQNKLFANLSRWNCYVDFEEISRIQLQANIQIQDKIVLNNNGVLSRAMTIN